MTDRSGWLEECAGINQGIEGGKIGRRQMQVEEGSRREGGRGSW